MVKLGRTGGHMLRKPNTSGVEVEEEMHADWQFADYTHLLTHFTLTHTCLHTNVHANIRHTQHATSSVCWCVMLPRRFQNLCTWINTENTAGCPATQRSSFSLSVSP